MRRVALSIVGNFGYFVIEWLKMFVLRSDVEVERMVDAGMLCLMGASWCFCSQCPPSTSEDRTHARAQTGGSSDGT